ncbi:MAG: 6-phosphofructokinase [Planctomycetes bacterium]|nr:6-phosphofructokinase [Planctomycetota bacterium]
MTKHRHVVALNTGGGDCPGLNAVIRAIVKRARIYHDWKIIGIEDSFDGLINDKMRVRELTRSSVAGALTRGGTLLGSTNRGNPFNVGGQDLSERVADRLRALGCEGLIALGGDGSMTICHELSQKTGLKVIGVPKTIDNDLKGTDITFGFNSAVEFATMAVDRLHTTAESHDRIMVVEVMGRDAGYIALHAGVAGGADAILIPEIPFDLHLVAGKILERQQMGRYFSIVVVAEGAHAAGGGQLHDNLSGAKKRLGGIGRYVAEQLHEITGIDARDTVLGHLQRGGVPTAFDRILASRLGNHAVDLVERGDWNRLVVMRNDTVDSIPLADAVGGTRSVALDHDLVATARGLGISFGDEV